MYVIAGWGTNEDLIISILSRRTAAQRKAIRQAYQETYGEDLLKDLNSELSSDFQVQSQTCPFLLYTYRMDITLIGLVI